MYDWREWVSLVTAPKLLEGKPLMCKHQNDIKNCKDHTFFRWLVMLNVLICALIHEILIEAQHIECVQ